MDVLITGGAGFIGSNFVREFAKGEYPKISKITVLDKLTYAGDFNNIKELVNDGAIQFIQGDICDSNLIREIIGKFDAIVNFAAESHVDRSIETPNEFVLSNIVGVQNLISHVEKSGETRFLQVSTDEVYGSILTGSSIESDCLKPSSVYSASKASAELLALSSYKTHGTDVVITRSSNNFGPFQHVEKLRQDFFVHFYLTALHIKVVVQYCLQIFVIYICCILQHFCSQKSLITTLSFQDFFQLLKIYIIL